MVDGDDIAAAQLSAARLVLSTRRLIDESRRTIRALQEQCERIQRHVEASRALLRGHEDPALVPVTTRR
jgi:hypothetical protein